MKKPKLALNLLVSFFKESNYFIAIEVDIIVVFLDTQ